MNDLALAGTGSPARIDRLTAVLAPATRESHRNGWRKWEAFAHEHGAFVETIAGAGAPTNPTATDDVRAAVKRAVRDYRDAGGTVHQSTGITAAAVARIEATAYQPCPRGRGLESPAVAKARADLEIAIIRTMRDCLARVSEAASFTWQQIERRTDGSATITFRRPKTDADTTAYLAPATVAALDKIRHGAADTARCSDRAQAESRPPRRPPAWKVSQATDAGSGWRRTSPVRRVSRCPPLCRPEAGDRRRP